MWASRKSMKDFGRSTSVPSGWVGSTKPRAASWITSAEQLAEQVGITRGCVTNQLITKCHLSSELFTLRKQTQQAQDHCQRESSPSLRDVPDARLPHHGWTQLRG